MCALHSDRGFNKRISYRRPIKMTGDCCLVLKPNALYKLTFYLLTYLLVGMGMLVREWQQWLTCVGAVWVPARVCRCLVWSSGRLLMLDHVLTQPQIDVPRRPCGDVPAAVVIVHSPATSSSSSSSSSSSLLRWNDEWRRRVSPTAWRLHRVSTSAVPLSDTQQRVLWWFLHFFH